MNERRREHPLVTYATGMCVTASGVRPASTTINTAIPKQLHLNTLKRYPWDEVELMTPVSFESEAVPSLCVLALVWAADHNQLDRIMAMLPVETVEALAMAVRNQAAQDAVEMAERADAAVDIARDEAALRGKPDMGVTS